MSRSPADEHARYNWITPATFGERYGGEKAVSADVVRSMIASGTIPPRFVHVVNPTASRKDYRIDPAAVDWCRANFKPQPRLAA